MLTDERFGFFQQGFGEGGESRRVSGIPECHSRIPQVAPPFSPFDRSALEFIIDSLLSIGINVLDSQVPNLAGIIGRIFLLIPMIQGINSIPKLPVQAEKKD